MEAFAASLKALGIGKLAAILLTHTHPDHLAGAAALSRRYGAKVYVHALEQPRLNFPAERLASDTFAVGHKRLGVHHTPGHSPGHLSFSLPDAQVVFIGDLLTTQGSTWVGLPEGDVAAYLASLEVLGALAHGGATVFGPGHGPLVQNPITRLEQVRTHRLAREAEILAALERSSVGPLSLQALRTHLYSGLSDTLVPLAEGTLLAHLEKLLRENRVLQIDGKEGTTWTLRYGQPGG